MAIGGQIQRLNAKLFLVKSQTANHSSYLVEWANDKWKCDCPDYVKRNKSCKHIFAVNFLLDLPSTISANAEMLKRVCPYCGSEKTVMKGFRYNKTGAVRLRLCKQCRRRFKDGIMAESKGASMALKLVAFDLHIKGVSLRNIKNHIWQVYCIDKPISTLHRWIVKLMGIMQEALSKVQAEVGDKWLADEMVVKVNGQERYLWNVMDYERRVHLVSTLTERRGAAEALMIIKEAIQEAGKNPRKLITDGLSSYSKALCELPNNSIIHVSNVGLTRQKDNNNRLERLQGTIRGWVKTQRGLKSRSQEHINVHRAYYNSIRPHMALQDKTPAKTKDGRWISIMIDKKRHKQTNASGRCERQNSVESESFPVLFRAHHNRR